MEPSPLHIVAYCCNILGAFFLMKSIMVKSPKYVLHELLDFKVNKSSFFRRYVSQRFEAVIGFTFLSAGQIILISRLVAVVENRPGTPENLSIWIVLAITIVALVLLAYVLSRVARIFSGRIFVALVGFMIEKHKFQLVNDQALVKELGRLLHVERDEDEDTVESYTKKVLDAMDFAADADSGTEQRDRLLARM
ncbi:MAG: hypothetical protein V3T86_11185 [Planctomycetota bacterium]